jgi:DNA-binding transcriptional ArsR family regulator
MKKLERTLKALANKRRLEILKYLKKEKEAHVGDIADKINLSFKSTSKHLSILFSVDIIEKEQRNLHVFYCISENLEPVAKYMVSII